MKLKFTLVVFLVFGSLISVRAQKLWGVTSSGVADNKGVVFSANADGTGYAVQHDFVSNFSGSTPTGALTLVGGIFYGMTSAGGDNSNGIIFKYDQVNDTYTKLFSFSTADGIAPAGSLLLASNGKLYGLAFSEGGLPRGGTIFEFDPAGAGTFTKKLTLGPTTGEFPFGSLMQATNSKLYAFTWSGGAHGTFSTGGSIIEYDITSGTLTFQYDLDPAAEGSNPQGDLVEGANGMLYGLTSNGGANGLGTLIEFDPNSHAFSKMQDFTGGSGLVPGSYPAGSLISASNDLLYGLTSGGGANDKGVLFSYNPLSNTYLSKIDLSVSGGVNPQGTLMQASNGKLYGTMYNGGTLFRGALFEYDIPSNTYTKDFDFGDLVSGSNPVSSLTEAPDGKLYGMVPYDGPASSGILYQFDPATSTVANKLSFSNAGEGSNPLSGVALAPNGKLYGTTSTGGDNGLGTIFEIDPSNSAFTKKVDFAIADGAALSGSLTLAGNGKFYGLASAGGTNGHGVLFEYDPGTTSVTNKFNFFGSVSGKFPKGTLSMATNGKLYGMTNDGGPGGKGVLFEFDPSNGNFTNRFVFPSTGESGTNPTGGLTQAANGKLYGMTNQGGSVGQGIFFEFNAVTGVLTNITDFSGPNGSFPFGEVIQGSNGKLYGLASGGGVNSAGVLFEYDYTPTVPVFTVKYSFITASGSTPKGALLETVNDVFFGTTAAGGSNGGGVLFKYALSGGYTNLQDLGGALGAQPQFGAPLLVPGKQTQTITFGALSNKAVGDVFALTATASSGLAVSYISSDPAIASISGGNVTVHTPGTVTITASQGGNASYFFAQSVGQTLTIAKATQTITFTLTTPMTYGDLPITLNGAASSGLTVSYVSSDPTVATVTGNILTILKAAPGGITITAKQAGDASFDPASDVSQNLVINKKDQSISFAPPATPQTYGTPFTITVTVTSGLPLSFSTSPAILSISGTGPTYNVTILGPSNQTPTITATQAGNGNYNAAPPTNNTGVVTINQATQTMTFGPLAAKTYGNPPFTLTGISTSGLPLTYVSSDPTVAAISGGNTVTILKAGSTQITPSQAGDANYLAAPGIGFQTLTVNKAVQTITFAPLPVKSTADPDFTLTATTNSSSPVTYSSSNPGVATVVGNLVHIVGIAGSTTISANAVADVNYLAATQVDQPFTVNTKLPQSITFNAIASKKFGSGTFTLAATASSNLPVTYVSGNTGVATISGNTVTIVGVGISTITASQAGDATYNPAPSVDQNLVVSRGDQTISFLITANPVVGGTFTLGGTASSGLPLSYQVVTVGGASISGTTVTGLVAGSTTIRATQLGNANYNAAAGVDATFCVRPVQPTISASGNVLTSSNAADNFWSLNGSLISSATQTITASKSGSYTVQVITGSCASDVSSPVVITGDLENSVTAFTVYPNPAKDRIVVDLHEFRPEPVEIKIIDQKGQSLHLQKVTGGDVVEIGISDHAAGLYILFAAQGERIVKARYVKGQ